MDEVYPVRLRPIESLPSCAVATQLYRVASMLPSPASPNTTAPFAIPNRCSTRSSNGSGGVWCVRL